MHAKMFKMMGVTVLMWADVFAYYVLWMTMTYLTDVWKISFTYAAAIINLWSGASEMLPVALAHLADAFVGNFSVLLTSTLSSCVGLGLLAMSTPPVLAKHTGTCSDYKPECIGHEQKLLFYIGLGLISIGTAGHATSLGTFAIDQLTEEERENGGVVEEDGCNMRVCTVFLGIFVMIMVPIAGIIVIPYVKPWSVRYGIAAIFSLAGTLMFLCGCCWYTYLGPQGSPLTTIVRVFVAATSKLFCRRPKEPDQLYARFDSDDNSDDELPHTNTFCCLDKAAIILPSKPKEEQEKNRWRLCTVTEVEGTKIFIRMIPMWMTFIACGLVSSVGNTYFLEQANHMNHKVGRLKVPLPVLLWIYDQAKSQSAKYYFMLANLLGSGDDDDEESQPSRYAPPVGIAVSMVFAILCCITAAKVEARRLHVVASHGLVDKPDERIPMSIFWLLPQFMLLGLLDGMYENSIECFFVDQVGPSMRRYMGFLSSAVFGGGIMGSALSVYVVGRISERGGRMNWFQRTINKSRLDNYYWVLAALSAVNLMVYIVVAWFYRYRESRSGGMEAPEYEETDGDRFEGNARCCC